MRGFGVWKSVPKQRESISTIEEITAITPIPPFPWNGSDQTVSREFENKEQTARKETEKFTRRSNALQRDSRIPKKTRELANKEQTVRTELANSEQGANRSKETREIENKEQAA